MFALQVEELNTGLKMISSIGQSVLDKLPNVLMAIGLFIAGWIVAKIVSRLVAKLLKSLKVDGLSDKLLEIEFIAKSGIDISLSRWLSKFVYYLVFFIFTVASIEVLGQRQLTELMTDMIAFLPKLLSAFAVLIFGILLSDKLRGLLSTSLRSLNIPSANMISKAIFYFLVVNVFVVSMAQSGIDMDFLSSNLTVLIGGIALAFGISYGLASKSLASNTISGFYAKEDIELGDDVTIDGQRGRIINIGNRNITLQADNKKIVIPFNQLTEKTIVFHE